MITRDELIAIAIEDGETGAVIGRLLGITRERVRQIAKRLKVTPMIPQGYIRIVMAAQALGYSPSSMATLIEKGSVASIKVAGRRYVVPVVIRESCRECGTPIPRGRWKHCSPECLRAAQAESEKKYQWRRFHERQKRICVAI